VCIIVIVIVIPPICAAVARWTVFSFLDNNDDGDEEERRTRGDVCVVCVCVVMQRDWETRESEKRDDKHNDGGWIFVCHYLFGGHSRNERDSHYHHSTHNKQHLTYQYNDCILLYTYLYQPFLNYWKISKSYTSYVIFFISFTLCRIVWVPYFIYTTYAIHLHGQMDILIWPSVAFYALQLAWFAKMW
jgi:hypothetical protein